MPPYGPQPLRHMGKCYAPPAHTSHAVTEGHRHRLPPSTMVRSLATTTHTLLSHQYHSPLSCRASRYVSLVCRLICRHIILMPLPRHIRDMALFSYNIPHTPLVLPAGVAGVCTRYHLHILAISDCYRQPFSHTLFTTLATGNGTVNACLI